MARIVDVVALASSYSGSPPESRLRLQLGAAGLPRPEVQWAVQDVERRTAYWLDLAWPGRRVGVEYDGRGHTDPGQVLRDIARHTRLLDLGWRVYRYTAHDVYRRTAQVVAELVRAPG